MPTVLKLVPLLLLCGASSLMAGALLQPTPAPEWEISTWLADDPGSLYDQRGRVVLIGFIQPGDAGCEESLLARLRRWTEFYGDRDLVVVLVHGFSGGHDGLTTAQLREFVDDCGIAQPVGIDADDGDDNGISSTRQRYEVSNTPHLAIVDKHGMLRFTHSGSFDPAPTEWFLQRLLEELPGRFEREPETASRPLPGGDLSGTFVFRTERATGPCATFMPPLEVPAELRFYRDAIDVEFTEPLLGLSALEMLYDAASGHVEGEGSLAPTGAAFGPNSVMRLDGELNAETDPPELEFEISLMNGNCLIPGRVVGEP
jgi:hypothetical protein